MSRNVVGSISNETDEVIYHEAGGTAGYHTLCGLSLDDDLFRAVEEDIPRRQRITCRQCFSVWQEARSLRATDFELETP